MGFCDWVNFLFVVLPLATHPYGSLAPTSVLSVSRVPPAPSSSCFYTLYAMYTWIANVFVCVRFVLRSSFLIYSLAFHKAMLNWTFVMVIDVFNVIGLCLFGLHYIRSFVYKNALYYRVNNCCCAIQHNIVTALKKGTHTRTITHHTQLILGWAWCKRIESYWHPFHTKLIV